MGFWGHLFSSTLRTAAELRRVEKQVQHAHTNSVNSAQKTYFDGANRYVCYIFKKPHYYYCEERPKKVSLTAQELFGLAAGFILCIVVLCYGIRLVSSAVAKPHKLMSDDPPAVRLIDQAGLIENEEELLSSMQHFTDETGIPLKIVTVYREDWCYQYDSLSDYASRAHFLQDDRTWVIMYSQPKHMLPDANTWEIYQCRGNEIIDTLRDPFIYDFLDRLRKALENKSYPLGADLAASIDYAADHAFRREVEWIKLIFGILLVTTVTGIVLLIIQAFIKRRFYPTAIQIPLDAQETVCDSCQKRFIRLERVTCPFCYALLPKEQNSAAASGDAADE